MARNANKSWNNGEDYNTPNADISQEQATRAVLQDIRDTLQGIHTLMSCHNVQKGFIAMQKLDRRMAQRIKLKDRAK